MSTHVEFAIRSFSSSSSSSSTSSSSPSYQHEQWNEMEQMEPRASASASASLSEWIASSASRRREVIVLLPIVMVSLLLFYVTILSASSSSSSSAASSSSASLQPSAFADLHQSVNPLAGLSSSVLAAAPASSSSSWSLSSSGHGKSRQPHKSRESSSSSVSSRKSPYPSSSPPSPKRVLPTQSHLLDEKGRFIVNDFDRTKPFSSFLPGIADTFGIPLWTFYVNRGQAISSFGVRSKDGAIMEFRTANLAYQETPWKGFRTILKATRSSSSSSEDTFIHEPFFPDPTLSQPPSTHRTMKTGLNEMEIEEIDNDHGIQTNVVYFSVTGQRFPGLIRRTTITNRGNDELRVLTMVDGLAQVVPTGTNDLYLKTMGRTLEAFMDVFHLTQQDSTLPFYHLRSGVADTEEVQVPMDGNFAAAIFESSSPNNNNQNKNSDKNNNNGKKNGKRLPMICDSSIVFGQDTTLNGPSADFVEASFDELLQLQMNQSTSSRTAAAFSLSSFVLSPGESITVSSVYGHVYNLEQLVNDVAPIVSASTFAASQLKAARDLADHLTSPAEFHSALPIFDASLRQLYMDNGLRGGFPLVLGDTTENSNLAVGSDSNMKKIFYTFSRLHGDIERDYNAFIVEPQFFSQGPGNFRDVNQNRRNDVLFEPRVGVFNIRYFWALIQADGYNPLTVQSSSFRVPPENIWKLASAVMPPGPARYKLCDVLGQPSLTPGAIFSQLEELGLLQSLLVSREQFVNMVVVQAEQNMEASYNVGYWTDHWTYSLDLIDSYLTIFPDRKQHVLFEEWVPFFYSPATVQPRVRKNILSNGRVKQVGSVYWDGEKQSRINAAGGNVDHNWQHGRENAKNGVVVVPIISKMVVLAIVKFASLDPEGMGLEMEGGKPGWLDALNGLPALFGSSLCESYELLRLLRFVLAALNDDQQAIVLFPVETEVLLKQIVAAVDEHGIASTFAYWDQVATARENYRDSVRLTFDGYMAQWKSNDLTSILKRFISKLQFGIDRALNMYSASTNSIAPTYFQWSVTQYEVLQGQFDWQGRPFVRAKQFKPVPLPLFLEGPVRQLKIIQDSQTRRDLFRQVKRSALYDAPLSMYRICSSMSSSSSDLGRIKAFAAGWLENESVWTHMSYKYYLELLRGGLYDEFFAEIQTGLIPFMDSQVYGRSLLEASSFIVSSAYSDDLLWGNGFVSRLSGATAEMMSMLLLMSVGPQPFSVDPSTNELRLSFNPILSADFFPADVPQVSFRFLGTVSVTYYHPTRCNTWHNSVRVGTIKLTILNGETKSFNEFVPSPYAEMVRSRQVSKIDVTLVSKN